MSVRIALPHHSPSVASPGDRPSTDAGAPLYLGGVLLVILLAVIVWTGLF